MRTLTHQLASQACFALFLMAASSTALAQAGGAPLRDGLHVSIGVGSASVSASCVSCETDFFNDRTTGFSGIAQIGGAVTSRLVLAAEFGGWIHNDAALDRRIASLNVVFLGYPSEAHGLFLKSGIGGLRAVAENELGYVATEAFMSQIGIGYDVPVGAVDLTPYVTYIRTFYGTTSVNGFLSPEVVYPNAIQVGVALTIH